MTLEKDTKNKILSENLFPVVGLGASAGGLDAFKKFIKAIPENSGMAYILVQHLHPEHSSSLPEILQRETNMPVHQISDNVKVQPNHVYIIPSNKMLTATDGVLQLSPRPSKAQKNMPIDLFFTSLAEVHQSHAIGIVLSGNGSDGTLGLKCIKAQGGITFAQDAQSAAYAAMPQSAINANAADFILAPEKMPEQLMRLNRAFNLIPAGTQLPLLEFSEEQGYARILALIRINNGVDFTYYKEATIRRRILRRVAILRLEKISDYSEYLLQHTEERDMLFQDMLIPVTSFFRDPKVFENLSETVFPRLIEKKSAANPLRIWIAGCSTGEEAYSIAMCLYEYLSDKVSTIKIQIFATDISQKSIAKARAAAYTKRELENVSASRLLQFFTKTEGTFLLKKAIRDLCVFAHHNFIKDPPFSNIDFISCRNVLIYMEPFLQKKAFRTFHYSLKDKGYLLLGKTETPGSQSEFFITNGEKQKLFIRKSLPVKYNNFSMASHEDRLNDREHLARTNEKKKDDFQKNADDFLLSKYSPAGVIVNDQFDIVQFRGSTTEFLEQSPGKPTLNVLKMCREGLAFELRNALHKSKSSGGVITKEGIPMSYGKHLINIEVVPFLDSVEDHYLILFKDLVLNYNPVGKLIKSRNHKRIDLNIERIEQLEKSLSQTREDMRVITDDQEAVNEELQSANEELLSSSEELQSLNEELETSKEELQSTNEELITVNQELFERNEQYNNARLYAEAIVTTIHEPLLVIDKQFKIISANKSFYDSFSVNEGETIGQVIFDIQNNGWNIPKLRDHILKVQIQNKCFLEWESTYKFPITGERTICFNAQPIQQENGENWILLAFNDITIRKAVEKAESKHADNLIRLMENIPQMTSTWAPNGDATYFNRFFLTYSGLQMTETLGTQWQIIIKPGMLGEFNELWHHTLSSGEDFVMEILLKRKTDNLYRWHLFRASPMRDDEGTITSWVGAATDIHDQKTKEESKDEFISIASHELKTPLTTVKAYVQLLLLGMEETNHQDLVFAQKADAAVDKLTYLISELLDMSKIQNGNLNLHLTSFNFNEMIAGAIEAVQFTAPGHKILVTGKIQGMVNGDQERLQQVIINLLSNAIKYSPKADSVFVNISKELRQLTVSITDTGIGIRDENLNKIFDRYYREEDRATHFQGLGIGLSICYDIIQRHNGKIWVESIMGQGSTFYLTIPVLT